MKIWICIFSLQLLSTVWTLPAPTTKTGAGCQMEMISQCFDSAVGKFIISSPIQDVDIRQAICNIAEEYAVCAKPRSDQCSAIDTLAYDFFSGALQYICTTEGYADFFDLLPCFTNNASNAMISSCLDQIKGPFTTEDTCRLQKRISQCLLNASRDFCFPGTTKTMQRALTAILDPLVISLCPNTSTITENTTPKSTAQATTKAPFTITLATTELRPDTASVTEKVSSKAASTQSTTTKANPDTTSPAAGVHGPPYQCYECHSGATGMWQNEACPPTGNLTGWAASGHICGGPCVSVKTMYPAGNVVRGCSMYYYFPFERPTEGCKNYNNDLFCFCSSDFCNNIDMSTL